MPPFFKREPGLLQARFPGLWIITMVVTGNAVEKTPVRIPQARQPNFVEAPANGKRGKELVVGHAENERRTAPQHARGFQEHFIDMRDMFEHGIADRTGKMRIREGLSSPIRLGQPAVGKAFPGFGERPPPGIGANFKFAVEGRGRKMSIPAAQIERRGRQIDIIVETRFHGAQQAPEIGHSADLRPEMVFGS